MSIRDDILAQLAKEIETGASERSLFMHLCRTCPKKERKRVAYAIRKTIERSIEASTEEVPVLFRRWISAKKILRQIVSLFVTKHREEKDKNCLDINRVVSQSMAKKAQKHKEELEVGVASLIEQSLKAPQKESKSAELPEEKIEHLKIQIYLLSKLGLQRQVWEKVTSIYTAHAVAHLKNIEAADQIADRLIHMPGLCVFAPGLQKGLRAHIRKELAPLVLDEAVFPRKHVHALLEARNIETLGKLLCIKVPKKEKDLVQKMFQWGVFEYIKEDPLRKALELRELPWPKKVAQRVHKAIKAEFVSAVREHTDVYTRILLMHMLQIFQKRTPPKPMMRMLKYIAENVSDTLYFEESLVSLIVDRMLKGQALKDVRRIMRVFGKKWPFSLTRRVKEILQDFSLSTSMPQENLHLIHANSFRWPANMERLDLQDIPDLSGIKHTIVAEKKKKRMKIEWVDSISTVDLEVDGVETTLSLLQYYLISKVQSEHALDISQLEKECKSLSVHVSPLLSRSILTLEGHTLSAGPQFSTASLWKNLAPEYKVHTSAQSTAPTKHLTAQALGCYLARTLKKQLACARETLVSQACESLACTASLVNHHIDALISKYLIKEENGILEYLP